MRLIHSTLVTLCLLVHVSGSATFSGYHVTYRPLNDRLSDTEPAYPGVCIFPVPVLCCDYYTADGSLAEIAAPNGITGNYCGLKRAEDHPQNPLKEAGLIVRVADNPDPDGLGFNYREKPFTIEVDLTSATLEIAEEPDITVDHLVATGFYCALMALSPNKGNAVTLRVVLPPNPPETLAKWSRLQKRPFHWDARKRKVVENSINGFVLTPSEQGTWYCCSEKELAQHKQEKAQ